jgi:hypothetical protein
MKNTTIIDTKVDDLVQLISKEDAQEQFGEAAASVIGVDSAITWAKFILTDDKPDANRQRIPSEEFDNLIKTGINKPIKMAMGGIKDGHEDAHPLGVITNLTKEGNKIVALAALWNRERGDDVAIIKELVNSDKPVNVSWEILYGASRIKNGVQDLLDTALRAVTIVGMPAYAGRTPVLAVAARKWSPAYLDKLPDQNFMHIDNDGTRYFAFKDAEGLIDPSRFPVILEEIAQASIPQNTLKDIRAQVSRMASDASIVVNDEGINMEDTLDIKELEGKIAVLDAQLALANNALAAKEKELVDALETAKKANETVQSLEGEIAPLREFKQVADKATEKSVKLAAIKTKFETLKVAKDDTYFEENAEKLLGMDESGLDFMLQEMVAFKDTTSEGEGAASKKVTSGVPNIQVKAENLSDPKELAKALTELRKNGKK